MNNRELNKRRVANVGDGAAGVMAAEISAGSGASVSQFHRMPSICRELPMAGAAD